MHPKIAVPFTIRILRSMSRDEVLRVLAEAVVAERQVSTERVFRVVLERESSLSSRVSERIAMPHAILEEMEDTVLALGICPDGVDWDGRNDSVQLVVLLVGPEEQHLPTMASVARFLQVPGILETIVQSGSESAVRALLDGDERFAAPVEARTLSVTAATVHHAAELARVLPNVLVVISTSNPGIIRMLGPLAEPPLVYRTYVVGPGLDSVSGTQPAAGSEQDHAVKVVSADRFPEDPYGPAALTLLPLLTSGVIHPGSEAILVSGHSENGGLDAVRLVDVSRELQVPEGFTESHLPRGVRLEVVLRALHLAAELGSQGREGKSVGTIIVIGDDKRLANYTQQMILNPFTGYSETDRNILDPGLSETFKELAKIDGAFIVSGDGTLQAVGTHLAGRPDPQEMEAGLGARHAAALGITASADVLAICLSESTGTITLYHKGRHLMRR